MRSKPARTARRPIALKSKTQRKSIHGERLSRANRFKSKARVLWAKIGRAAQPLLYKISGLMANVTGAFDAAERRAPSWLASGIRTARLASPINLGAYFAKIASRDKKFFGGVIGGAIVVANLTTVALVALGVDPLTAFVARYWTEPAKFAVVAWRQRAQLRKTVPNAGFKQVGQQMAAEYREVAAGRLARSRERFKQDQPRASRWRGPREFRPAQH
jgi:hypothetical protein